MSLIPEIKERIDAWLEAGSHRSIADLARRASLSYSATRRIAQGESSPTYTSLNTLLAVVCKNENVHQLLSKQFPDKLEFYRSQVTQTAVSIDKSLREIGADGLAIVIYGLISSGDGVEVEVVRKMYGECGLEKMRRLADVGLVTLVDDRVSAAHQTFTVTDLSMMKQLIASHVDQLHLDNLANERGFLTFRNFSVNRSGYRKIISVLEKASAQIQEIMDTQKGVLPIHFSAVVDSYLSVEPAEKGVFI